MKRNQKITALKQYRKILVFLQEEQKNYENAKYELEHQKVLVLKKNYYGRNLRIG